MHGALLSQKPLRGIIPGMPPKPKMRRRHFLKEWRTFRELTQETAAARIGIDQSTLSRIERGHVPYDQDFLEAAAYAYMCDPADLIMRNPGDADAPWSIMDSLKKASPEQKEQVRAVVDALLKRTG